jgi:hypothetical protein
METLVGCETHFTVLQTTGHAGRCSRIFRAQRAARELGLSANALRWKKMRALRSPGPPLARASRGISIRMLRDGGASFAMLALEFRHSARMFARPERRGVGQQAQSRN